MSKKKRKKLRILCLFIAALLVCTAVILCPKKETPTSADPIPSATTPQLDLAREKIKVFADSNAIDPNEYPAELINLLATNPDAEDFVLYYPLKKDFQPEINLLEYKNLSSVPLFLQWDERWGYNDYGGELFGLSGCGPTCLSMVCVYLLDDTRLSPKYIAEFSKANGYCVAGNGSSWELISRGGETLGLDVVEIPLDENRIKRNLEVGNPVICVMGPGDFTTSGHFIVLTAYEDGKLKINDPNSKSRSQRLWEYDDIKGQIRNLWVCR